MHRSRDNISSIEIFPNAKPDGNIRPDRPFEENRLVVVFIQVRISDFSNGGHATSVAKPNIKSGYAVKSKTHVDGNIGITSLNIRRRQRITTIKRR